MFVVIDTNAFIRLLTNDDPQKGDLVEKLLKEEKDIFIPDVVFSELEYILIKRYKFSRKKLLDVYKSLSSQNNISLTFEARFAISIFENSKLDMADCIVASYSKKGTLASFDSDILEIKGVNAFWKYF